MSDENDKNELAKFEKQAFEEMEKKISAADDKSMKLIEEYIADGFYKTLAKLAVYLGKERAKTLLQKLPQDLRSGIEQNIDALGEKNRTDPAIIVEAAQVLKKTGFYGKEMADSVIEKTNQEELAALLHESDKLFERNPVLAINVEHYLFTIEDLVILDDRSIQRILREVTQEVLAKALKNTSDSVRDKIYRNLSKRAASVLQEDIDFMGPIRISDVYEAQKEIIDIVKRLEKNGEIVIARLATEELVP